MITTVSDNQTQILKDIQELHHQGQPFQADVTFSTGSFWKGMDYVPEIRSDLDPNLPGLTHPGLDASRDLIKTFGKQSIESIVFDPPFIHAPGKASIIGNRFGGYRSQAALQEMYYAASYQIRCVLKPGGLLIWKCQDIVESGKQVWSHLRIHDFCVNGYHAVEDGHFVMDDLFILTAKNRIQGHNHGRQVHARKNHAYFLVFKRSK